MRDSRQQGAVHDEAPSLDDEKVYKPVLYSISSVLLFKALCHGLTVNARVKTFIGIFKGDTVAAAKTLGSISAIGALLEFVVGPAFGKLSDIYGRKFVMQLAPVAIFISNLLITLRPRALWVHFLRIPVIALDTAFFAAMRAMMADVMSGKNIAANGLMSMAPAGLATIAAPLLASRLSVNNCFRFSTVLAGLCIFVLNRMMETLPPWQRMKPSSFDVSSCNPFAFYHLFTNGRGLATLSLVSWVQTFTDSRLLEETATFVMRETAKLNDKGVQLQLTYMALSGFWSVPIGSASVKRLGRLGHTHFCHFFNVIGFLMWSRATSVGSLIRTQLILMFSQRKRDGVETLMTDVGVKKSMGKGQMEAYKMNLRSVSNFLAPMVYARVFTWGKTQGRPSSPFVFAAVISALSELIMLSLKECDLKSVLGVSKVE